jgi:integrase
VQVTADENGNPLDTKKAAEAYLRRVMSEQHTGVHVPRPDAMRCADLPELYLAAEQRRVTAGRLTPAVLANKRRDLVKAMAHLPRNLPLPDLRPRHVDLGIVPALEAAGMSPKTIREVVNTLRHALSWAARQELVPVNRLADVRHSDTGQRPDLGEMLEPEKVAAAIDAAPGYREVLRLAAYTGLRRGELRALAWNALDLDRGVVRVLRAVKPKIGIGETKTGAGRREVPLMPFLRAELASRWLALPLPRDKAALVFPARDGGISDGGAWLNALAEGCEAAGLQALRLHDLRHFYASLLIREGFDRWRICELMGHGSINITETVYRHWLRDDVRNASDAAKLQAAIRRRT